MFSRLHRRDLRLVFLLLLIATIMLGSTWFGARRVESYMIQKQAEHEVFNWARFAEVHIADFNQILLYGRVTDEDEALIAAMAEANNVLRYRFFNRAGFIVLSSVPGEVGRRDINTYLSDVVLGGGTFIKLQEDARFFDLEPDLHGGSAARGDGSFRNDFELPSGTVLAEAYTAVMENGRFNGAIEVHVNMTQMAGLVHQIVGFMRSVIWSALSRLWPGSLRSSSFRTSATATVGWRKCAPRRTMRRARSRRSDVSMQSWRSASPDHPEQLSDYARRASWGWRTGGPVLMAELDRAA